MGAEFNEKLAEQKPVFSRDMRNDARRVARGEYPIYITQVFAFASDLKGLPVKVVVPKEGAPYAQMDMAMLKSAPHPNAARLFMQHFLSVDSQCAVCQCLDASGRAGRGRQGRSGRTTLRQRQADGPGQTVRARRT